jgi:hypothetical protein
VLSELLNKHMNDIEDLRFYSLMPAEHRAAFATVPDIRITDLSFFVSDFRRTAAAMACMNEIVSVCQML